MDICFTSNSKSFLDAIKFGFRVDSKPVVIDWYINCSVLIPSKI